MVLIVLLHYYTGCFNLEFILEKGGEYPTLYTIKPETLALLNFGERQKKR